MKYDILIFRWSSLASNVHAHFVPLRFIFNISPEVNSICSIHDKNLLISVLLRGCIMNHSVCKC